MLLFKDLMWFFKLEKKSYSVGIVMLVFVAVLNLFPPYVVRVLVDGVSHNNLTLKSLLQWSLWLAGTGLVVYGLRFVWRLMIFGAASRLSRLLRQQLFDHFTRLSPQFYQQHRTGDLMAHATNDIQAIETTAGMGVLTFVDSLTTGGLVVISMAIVISWKLTLITLLPMPLMAWSTSRYGTMLHQRFHRAQAAFSDLNDKVLENITGVRVVKAFGEEEAETEAFRRLSADVVEKNIAVAKVDALFDPTIQLIIGFSFFLALVFGAKDVVKGNLTFGQLTQFTIYLGQFIWPMLAFGWLFNILERGRASYDRVHSLLNIKQNICEREEAKSSLPMGDVEFRQATFTYPATSTPVLQDLNVLLRSGQTLGIVGKTGSGKTTFLRLLLREFDLSGGDLRIGGTSIYAVTLDALRKTIGYVPQDHFLFSISIAENIAFGKPEASLREIQKVAKIADIHNDIERLAKNYDTLVGDRGVTLSGGQKQRISIARALLTEPEILILDDSLSAVDAKTEKSILQGLREVRTQKTTFISSHRLSAVEHADLIIVLKDGQISEQGSHAELMELDGWYASTYRSQQIESSLEEGEGD
ncbi:ABC transporter transmembrane domain-containing protein [Desulfosporosinus sp. PR]|uniref:ABC transporter transmembrane domain-containing protein n=1 Tax=Candidatus Desulfosporosinus nitrosoreducens TaxID=3401928 RepID=UPI0027F0138C|nr:ABC transporter transmembrane domain-containing protein [Desulfosporosinus sp. PR]MDQ7093468.1 ABC transporter transmembrane domain-containing protein [Desulfosporosinus sp. PR]